MLYCSFEVRTLGSPPCLWKLKLRLSAHILMPKWASRFVDADVYDTILHHWCKHDGQWGLFPPSDIPASIHRDPLGCVYGGKHMLVLYEQEKKGAGHPHTWLPPANLAMLACCCAPSGVGRIKILPSEETWRLLQLRLFTSEQGLGRE